MKVNRQVVLLSRPNGRPAQSDFALRNGDIAEIKDGEILIRNQYFSMEPAIRGWLDPDGNYFPPVAIGDPVRSPTLGVVVSSRHPSYQKGNYVRGLCRWEEYSVLGESTPLLEVIQPKNGLPLSYYVGPLSGSGLSAYIGLHEIGRIKSGETVVISAAAGAVGSIAGQIARLRGCRVIGLVGSDVKARIALEQLRYDAVINYKECGDLSEAVYAACPDGVDVYFDSVGGATLNSMLMTMRPMGRIVACGMISGYNQQKCPPPVYNLWEIVSRQLEMKGFLLPYYVDRIPEAMSNIESWIMSGEITVLENKRLGIENAASLFCDLMSGDTVGKTVLELNQD